MSTAAEDLNLNSLPSKILIESQLLGRSFEILRRGDAVQQSEFQTETDGTEVFRETEPIDWVVGAGVNGYSYLSSRKGRLVEAPLSFYSRGKKWDLSPGYQQIDMGFDRPVTTACLSCHSGRLRRSLKADGGLTGTPFQELAIGCESCHGPGESHVLAKGKERKTTSQPDRTIVNPAKLPPVLAENICMFCHEGGDVRVLQPGKTEQDFRPGTWLNETFSIFKLPTKKTSPARESDLLEHHYSLQLSKCSRESEAQISCLTCHDVHNRPAPDRQAEFYRAKCLSCHAANSCSLPLQQRGDDNCVGCHMPKRDLKEISHSALTNHRIVRRPDEPLPESAYHDGGAPIAGLIHLNVPAEDAGRSSTPSLSVLLQAYHELQLRDGSLKVQFLRTLEAAAELHSNDATFEAIAGEQALNDPSANNSDAVKLLSAAIGKGWTEPSVYLNLATALARSGKVEAAIETLKAGTVRHPLSALLHKELIARLIKSEHNDLAVIQIRKYMDLFPQDSLVRDLQKQLSLR